MVTNKILSKRVPVALSLIAVLATSFAEAEETKAVRPMAMPSCEEDRVRFCSNEKDSSELVPCLSSHKKEISTGCRQELEKSKQMRWQALAHGGGAFGSFGGLNATNPPAPLISYAGRYDLGENSPSFTENKINISSPIFRAETDTVTLSLAGGNFHIGDSLVLSSGKQVPQDLYRAELGAQYFKKLPDKKIWGLRGSVGFAGDKPFVNTTDLTYNLSANYGFPGSGNGYWLLNVFISNNNPLKNFIPVPGFIYLYKTESFTGMFGFPVLSMQWTPVYPWSFSLAVFGPNIHSEVGYGSIARFQLFSGFYWVRQNYLPSDRNNVKDRLTIEEKKAAVGIRIPVLESMLAEIQLGQGFDRTVYIGNRLFNKDGGSISLPVNWYLSTGMKLKF